MAISERRLQAVPDHEYGDFSSQSTGASQPRISIVMPTKNEAKNLPHVFELIPDDIHEIVVVDGYSRDDTVAVAESLDARVRVIEQTRPGKGNALAHGFGAVTGDIVVMLDADCSADPREIPLFVDALRRGADMAKGSRYMPGGGSDDITRLRSQGNRRLTGMVNLLFRTGFTDLCYGYNAFWTHCLPQLAVDSDGFEVETQIAIRAAKAKLRIEEVPSHEFSRRHGVSNLNAMRDGLRVQRTILRELAGQRGAPIVEHDERRQHVRGVPTAAQHERRACFVHGAFA
jgi:glycosyltransferase involved in cell wall biosynthesis